jgi:hypothetical protein
VIATRVSPKQKANIVLMMKERYRKRTGLAIGDGSNDVSGGIGISFNYSSGDYIGCCQASRGRNASMRFEWYVR